MERAAQRVRKAIRLITSKRCLSFDYNKVRNNLSKLGFMFHKRKIQVLIKPVGEGVLPVDSLDRWVRKLLCSRDEQQREDEEYQEFIKMASLSVQRDLDILARQLWILGFKLRYFLDGDGHDVSDFKIIIEKIPEYELEGYHMIIRSLPLSDKLFDGMDWCDA